MDITPGPFTKAQSEEIKEATQKSGLVRGECTSGPDPTLDLKGYTLLFLALTKDHVGVITVLVKWIRYIPQVCRGQKLSTTTPKEAGETFGCLDLDLTVAEPLNQEQHGKSFCL